MMWVWDDKVGDKVKRKVIYFNENKHAHYPIIALFPDTRSKDQKKKDRKEYFKRKRKMHGSFTIEVKTKGLRLERHYTTKGDRRK